MEHPYRPFDEDTDYIAAGAQKSSQNAKNMTSSTITAVSQTDNNPQDLTLAFGDHSTATSTIGNKVRLRAIESESEYFLKLMNVTVLRWFALIQAIATGIIFLSQVLLYAYVTKSYYKPVDFTGIGIWAPLCFFSVAGGLTWLTTKSPSGCCIGTAMGFQITSAIIGAILLIFSIISLVMHGRYSYYDNAYDPEVAGRVFCSFMILGAATVIITGIFTSIHFCRAICCGRQRTVESIMFDVETVK